MQAVIMAAGRGTRLKPLTLTIPKPLLKVAGKTLLERNLSALPAQVDEVVIVINYLGDQIVTLLGNTWHDKKITYVRQQRLTGTAGAIIDCREVLRLGSFLVINGDDLYEKSDLEKLRQHKLAMLTTQIKDPTTAATCTVDTKGCLLEVVEAGSGAQKPPFLANCGAYVLNDHYFKVAPVKIANGELGLPQTLAVLAQKGYKIALIKTSSWQPVGNHQQLKKAEQKFGTGL